MELRSSRFDSMDDLREKFQPPERESFEEYVEEVMSKAKRMKASTRFLVEAQLQR